jgi:serine/threonine protein kinase
MDASELVGTTFDGRFQLERLLGQGGMGVVYLAFHVVLQRHFALKVIHQNLLAEDDLEQMFRREARAASRVQHPHVTFVFDYSNSVEGIPYIVMEYVDGMTMAHELGLAKRKGEPFPLLRCLDILAQVADALSAAHACGVVHRDLKPANVALTTRRGRKDFVKVLDFGLAKLVKGSTTLNAVDSDAVFGTPEYMSPEQCLMQGDGDIDHRSDIYGLGIMAYEALTGAPPFIGEPLSVLYAHQEKPPPVLFQPNGQNLPESLVDLVMSMLAKDPSKRPQSAQDVAGELLTILAELRGDATISEETAVLPVFGPQPGVREVRTTAKEVSPTDTHISAEVPDAGDGVVYADAETHALGDLVRMLRERKLGSANTVHLYTRMLEMDDAVAELEHESDLVHGQILHLEMRNQEREARLREALVEVEHEMARQSGRDSDWDASSSVDDARLERELRRLTRRAEDLASYINRISADLEARLSDQEAHLIALQTLLGERREDANNLRQLLKRQLAGLRADLPPDDDELFALFLTADIV